MTRSRFTLTILGALIVAALASVSAHPVRGLLDPTLARAFVSSPSAALDAPIPIAWGTQDTGLRVACFFVANSSPARADDRDWPRITAVGLELPGAPSGFALVAPLDGDWELVEGVSAALPGHGTVTIDVALVARVNQAGWHRSGPHAPLGIPPGQPEARGSGTRFCLSGPFPANLNIEQVLNGVVVRFHRVWPHGPAIDIGVWDNVQRTIPLYPE
jgi:hypothetical protein